jgi:CRISPR/Cas system-associated endoribonuclease Cas2
LIVYDIATSNNSQAHYFAPSLTTLKRSAFTITLTEDSDMAAAAKIGDSSMPKKGYRTPAAMGTPAEL